MTRSQLVLTIAISVTILCAMVGASGAYAGSPEQLDQLEPEAGEWQLEYYGQFGTTEDTERNHALEAFYGVSDGVAIGFEIEGEAEDGTFEINEFGAMALFKLVDPDDAPVGAGLMLAAAMNDDGELTEAEARFIVERVTETWWAQANVMLRHVDEDGEQGEFAAYSWSLQHAIADDVWFGAEGSGQAFDFGGFDDEDDGFEAAHFVGPSLTAEFELSGDSEVEAGLAWFTRLGDAGAKHTLRLFVQVDL
ncbi:hypothetical protein KCG44_07550 [Pacificimonas sp. WHA3]|uniref:Uncharacterized protein n=1 Tax=Pacificimonas pallii TaxID=2827236 RepID=A0ABS6SEW3_9SPHN|nr:hypothetical protein [Pacificimonas pallii]MBV7256638.1 hypothetical protein [Pacificimonas pallii]